MSKKRVLIKCGGSILEELSSAFFSSVHELRKKGYEIVIVHGGGPDINKMLQTLNVEPEYVDGLRKTDEKTLSVVEMVLSGQTNRKLVQMLLENDLPAIGLNGSDANLLQGDFVDKEKLGYVGEIKGVNTKLLEMVLEQGIIPVITPIAIKEDGTKLNVNADYAATAVANALQVEHCLFVTDVEGIIINGTVKKALPLGEVNKYIAKGEIYGGMIPKVNSAIKAIKKGIDSVRIVAGKKSFFQNNEWFGTKIYEKERVV